MKILRVSAAVLAGYLIFAVSALLLFRFTGIDPHSVPSIGTGVLVVICGIIFSFVGGWVAQRISISGNLTTNYILAAMIAVFAGFSLLKSPGSSYTQLAAIFLFAPASWLGGSIQK